MLLVRTKWNSLELCVILCMRSNSHLIKWKMKLQWTVANILSLSIINYFGIQAQGGM